MSPVVSPGVCAMPAASSASSGMFGRFAVALGIHMSVRHAAIFPSSPTAPSSESSCGGAFGSQPCSSSRDHWTRTGRATAFDNSAASAAASSWPFIP